jgi:hypothetical protein
MLQKPFRPEELISLVNEVLASEAPAVKVPLLP